MKKIFCLLAFIFAGAAHATPLQWNLNNVVFDDGTSVTGSYEYDADTNVWSNWSITVQDGTLSAFTYTDTNSNTHSANNSALGFLYVNDTYSRYINFNFVDAMTNSGGTINLELATSFTDFQTGSWECNNCSTWRWIVSGSASTANSVPEPAPLALLGLALAGLAVARRKISV